MGDIPKAFYGLAYTTGLCQGELENSLSRQRAERAKVGGGFLEPSTCPYRTRLCDKGKRQFNPSSNIFKLPVIQRAKQRAPLT